jgi:hypothetical protein
MRKTTFASFSNFADCPLFSESKHYQKCRDRVIRLFKLPFYGQSFSHL